jgi:Bacterial PH domain
MADTLRQRTAPTCPAIRIVTGIVLLITAGLLIASLFSRWFLPVAALMAGIVFICYRTAPVSFELDRGALTVVTRAGRRSFGPVVRCSRLDGKPGLTLRLWGNGGVFAGTGIYWNRQWGVFRAYVTAGSYDDYVLIEMMDKKVLISPEDPAAFVETCATLASG